MLRTGEKRGEKCSLLYQRKQLTTADADTIFWMYWPIKAMFLQIWIEIAAVAAAYETWRTMTLSVEFQIIV